LFGSTDNKNVHKLNIFVQNANLILKSTTLIMPTKRKYKQEGKFIMNTHRVAEAIHAGEELLLVRVVFTVGPCSAGTGLAMWVRGHQICPG
jgi:hypothetical protein